MIFFLLIFPSILHHLIKCQENSLASSCYFVIWPENVTSFTDDNEWQWSVHKKFSPYQSGLEGRGQRGWGEGSSDDESNEHIELHMARVTHSDNFILILTLGDINKDHWGSWSLVQAPYYPWNIDNIEITMQRTLLSMQLLISATLSFRVVKQLQTAEVCDPVLRVLETFSSLFRNSLQAARWRWLARLTLTTNTAHGNTQAPGSGNVTLSGRGNMWVVLRWLKSNFANIVMLRAGSGSRSVMTSSVTRSPSAATTRLTSAASW